jgi:hypothetical protein
MIRPDNMLAAVAAHCLKDVGRKIHLTNSQIRVAGETGDSLKIWAGKHGLQVMEGERDGWAGWWVWKDCAGEQVKKG